MEVRRQLSKKSGSEVKVVFSIFIFFIACFKFFSIAVPLLGFLISEEREGYAGAMNHSNLYVVNTYLTKKRDLPDIKEDI